MRSPRSPSPQPWFETTIPSGDFGLLWHRLWIFVAWRIAFEFAFGLVPELIRFPFWAAFSFPKLMSVLSDLFF